MNIQEAKEEIIRTLKAYTAKDDRGQSRIPEFRQRPVFLIGPPGIGKTAIMEQAARECQVGLISYTITHHTRQSAVGLPKLVTKTYGDQEYTMTEYTMSEIIARSMNIRSGPDTGRESCLSTRSTVSPRRWRRRCFSFCSTRCSGITRFQRAG